MALSMIPTSVKALKEHEGLELKAYLDAAGVWTIGYGHTGSKYAQPGVEITKAKAEQLFKEDLKEAEDVVKKYVTAEITDPMYSALVSFVYNVGPGKPGVKSGFVWLKNGKKSTILTKINNNDFLGAAEEFSRWVFANGKKLNGLVKRRAAERAMFLSGVNILSTDDENEGNIVPDAPKAPNPAKEPGVIATTTVALGGALKEIVEAVRPVEGASEGMMYVWLGMAAVAVIFVIWKATRD